MIEYNKPNNIFESTNLEIRAGKTVLKSIIDIVNARKKPCHITIKYVFLFSENISKNPFA
jgi:hypothetical protein